MLGLPTATFLWRPLVNVLILAAVLLLHFVAAILVFSAVALGLVDLYEVVLQQLLVFLVLHLANQLLHVLISHSKLLLNVLSTKLVLNNCLLTTCVVGAFVSLVSWLTHVALLLLCAGVIFARVWLSL